jgi:hypothetical protein
MISKIKEIREHIIAVVAILDSILGGASEPKSDTKTEAQRRDDALRKMRENCLRDVEEAKANEKANKRRAKTRANRTNVSP